MSFRFVDLFAGIGGFHAALGAAGGRCVFVSEIDASAAAVYEANWGNHVDHPAGRPVVEGDIQPLTAEQMVVPDHDVLAAGFPCQPFSKSGFQRGMSEARGTLFWNICRVLEERRPSVVLLENVRNIAGPRHVHEWQVIIDSLRDLGYRVSSEPTVFSPHLLPPELGGTPQVRERVFIVGTYVGRERAMEETNVLPTVAKAPVAGWDPYAWNIEHHLLDDDADIPDVERYRLNPQESAWLSAWDDFVQVMYEEREGAHLPGFPIWADCFDADVTPADVIGLPAWKANFVVKNSELYRRHRRAIDKWLARHDHLAAFPPSRRKLEWQAQNAASLYDTVLHFRPSGIRAKRPTYLPALVAITQTSVIGWRQRRITPREAARLQGLPEWFSFGAQADAATYKQLGNGVAVGAAYYVFRQHVLGNARDLPAALVRSVAHASDRPLGLAATQVVA